MEWQQIIGFYHVVRLGSFTRAADVTYRTQSALSYQIKSLENELGCQLIERIGRKKLGLTLAGEKLFNFAEKIIVDHDMLVSEISEIKGVKLGRVRVASPYNTLFYLLPPYISKYIKLYPNVELTLMDRPPISVIEMLREGQVDFGITMESAVPKDLNIRHWKKADYVVMVPKGHRLLKQARVTLEQVAEYPLILPPQYAKSSVRHKLLGLMEKNGIKYNISMESSNAAMSMKYIELGLGISFFLAAQELAAARPPGLEIISMRHYFESEYISLSTRKDKLFTPAMEAFQEVILDTN